MAGGIGQTYVGTGTTITSAVTAAPADAATLLTLASLSGLSVVTVWAWVRQPQDMGQNRVKIVFGGTTLAFLPLKGGTASPPEPLSVQFTGDTTNITLVTVGAFIGPIISVMFTTLAANA